ncbi:hypothetical protein ACFQ5D_13870 [Paenibacillus farraposensis]|uniref:Uncharacterized protein n=1 Tax=Paenibacillus farraposensis TaxID=2807095 RepID=A0ABW4DCP2_9BACL|nr:hypothetical protein [Paenibacillus farraposensis]
MGAKERASSYFTFAELRTNYKGLKTFVEILPDGEPVIKDIESLHSYGRKLFDEPIMDHANIGNDLYIAVGDSSALMGKPVNSTISYGSLLIFHRLSI